ENILFIYLRGSYNLIHGWLEKRQHHFMPVDLLKSQFDTLEEPSEQEKDVITINLIADIEEEMAHIVKELQARNYLQ
ncbi:MAG TPA: gluconokinase, partial [Arachidicoccus sp.]